MTDFCKNCNHILEMTRALPTFEAQAELLNTATPDELSDVDDNKVSKVEGETVEGEVENGETVVVESESEAVSESAEEEEVEDERDDEAEEFYETILKAVDSDQPLTGEQLAQIDVKKMIKTEYYRALKSKSAIKKKILGMIEDMGNSDENTTFYLFCTNCGYSRPLDSGFHILSKNPSGVASLHNYSDESKIRNAVHTGIHPRTREFTCPNKECASHKKGNPTEAVFIRDGDTYRLIYVCTTCLTIKRM
jgi:hypothetical protein